VGRCRRAVDRYGRHSLLFGGFPMSRCGKIHSVMILENHLGLGGLEKKLLDFVSRIDPQHYRVVVCCLKDAGHLKNAFVDLGVSFYEGLLKHKYDVFAFQRLLSVVGAERVELIYTLPHPNSVIFSSIARRLGRVERVVVSVHGTGGPMGGRMVRGYLKPFFGGVDRFIAVADDHKRYLVESEELPVDKVVVIHNGVDVAQYHPGTPNAELRRVLGVTAGDHVITTVASLYVYKGVDVLMYAARDILRGCHTARFVVVGDGPERPSLQTLASNLGIADRVTFTGIRSDVDEILRLSDVFVLPSRTEAFPNVILEAMASGLPVVATDVGSVRELVDEGKTGYRVPPNDPEALSQVVCGLLHDAETARRLGAAGRRVVEDRFRLEGMCEKRERLFDELLCR
jgi:glycosyltransferase involved in cell wall biosynthesis